MPERGIADVVALRLVDELEIVDIEQRDGSAPCISVTGSRLGDVLLPVDDAKRLALAILARVDQAEATAV